MPDTVKAKALAAEAALAALLPDLTGDAARKVESALEVCRNRARSW